MAFRRVQAQPIFLEGDALTAAMIGIGMNFAGQPDANPNIENTLLAASIAGLEREDYRVLSVLMSWLEIHSPWINVDRLTRLVLLNPSPRIRCFWAAVAKWLGKDRRFARMARAYLGANLSLLATGNEFHLDRSGEDPRFTGGPLRVPKTVLRERPSDVLTPTELAKRHNAYRRRVLLGPSFRADMWSELELDPALTSAELARRTYGSFATAWHVKQDWGVLAGMQTI